MQLASFSDYVTQGELIIVEPSGTEHRFGSGEPRVTLRLHEPETLQRILRNPGVELGETYVAGAWDAGEGGLAKLLWVLRRNLKVALKSSRVPALARLVTSWNNARASIANVAKHYDLDESLFRAFLDEDMHYSCAYFSQPDMTLEDAQRAKCAHLATKLKLEEGQRVLDIGSGWGSLGLHLAAEHGVDVTGITLSKAQHEVATAEAERRALSNQVRFLLADYRDHEGNYDRIVSVGMFEHVGRRYMATFFRRVAKALSNDGVAVLHTIASTSPPAPLNPWMRAHIFPGGYIPSLSDTAAAIERAGLIVTDLEVWRDHYAKTLAEWNRRFQAKRAAIAAKRSEAFCRMWEFYLAASQAAFECRDIVVHQWQLAHHGVDLPLTRDYMYRDQARPER